jgi:hypothetical protein
MSHEYARRAEQHRPRTPQEVRRAAQEMARDGLGDYSIAAALNLDVVAVRRLIGKCPGCDE